MWSRRGCFSPNARRPLAPGAEILLGDAVGTGEATRIELRMVDDTVVTLGDNARVEVRNYLVSAELATGNVALGLLEGTFRLVTGRLTGGPERPLVVTTPLATIGAATSVTARDRAPSPPVRLTPEQLEAAAGTVSW